MRNKYEDKESAAITSTLDELFLNMDKNTIELPNSVMVRTFYITSNIEAVSISLKDDRYFVTIKAHGDEWWIEDKDMETYERSFDDIIFDDRVKLVNALKNGIHI